MGTCAAAAITRKGEGLDMEQLKKIDCRGSQSVVLGRKPEKGLFWAEEARNEDIGELATALLGPVRGPGC